MKIKAERRQFKEKRYEGKGRAEEKDTDDTKEKYLKYVACTSETQAGLLHSTLSALYFKCKKKLFGLNSPVPQCFVFFK